MTGHGVIGKRSEWDDLLQNQWNKVQFKSKNVNKTINLGEVPLQNASE